MDRPNPDDILSKITEVQKNPKGKLRIFLGYAAGVGKTYAMLDEAKTQLKLGKDIVVGYVEPHTRPETIALLEGLPSIEPLKVNYKNIVLREFDLQTALKRKPDIILVDELAHTNAEGLRNKKRYQDIEELLNAGINVYTTMNIQHIESLNDIVEDITHIAVKETVPDFMIDNADKIKLVDIEPEELLMRLEEGKIYNKERAASAMANFFTVNKLRLLREMALRKATDRVSSVNQRIKDSSKVASKYMVCINASPSSAKCIRWTARYAEAFRSDWCAVYVETSNSIYFSEKENKTIKKNMELARTLGADVTIISGDNIAAVISEYAKLSGITNFVIGKSRKNTFFKKYFKSDLEDEIVRMVKGATIHVITDNDDVTPEKRGKRYTLKNTFLISWRDVMRSIGVLTIATATSLFLDFMNIADHNVVMVYILAVLIISVVTEGYFYGIVSALFSVLLFNYLFVEPLYTFTAIQPEYTVTFIIMFLVALITSALMNKIKMQAKQSAKRAKRSEILYEINKKLLITRGLDKIVEVVNEYLVTIFERSVIFYYDNPQKPGSFDLRNAPNEKKSELLLREEEKGVANWVFLNKKVAGFGTDTLMGASVFYMPIISQNSILGVLGISCTNKEIVNLDNRNFLRMIVSLIATAMERQSSSDEQRRLLVESEKEMVRSNLLRAISHDLRTPLTAMLGASSVLIDSKDNLDQETKGKLLTNIYDDASWLIRLVENLLSVTKLNEEGVSLKKTPEAVEEVVAEAVSRIRNKYPDVAIKVKVPDELLIVLMDGTLIEQVIINLLENAIKYSGNEQAIELNITKENDKAIFNISDNGVGIPPSEIEHLFDGNLARNADNSRGMGIGLSICKSIVLAHGGQIYVKNKESGGAIFMFVLPIGDLKNEK